MPGFFNITKIHAIYDGSKSVEVDATIEVADMNELQLAINGALDYWDNRYRGKKREIIAEIKYIE